jgi:protease PrsW
MNLFLLAIAPSLAIALLFYLRDKYDHEPLNLLVKTFALGAMTIVPVGILESAFLKELGINIFEENGFVMTLFYMLFLVAAIEELAKYSVVRFYAWDKKAFNEPYDGIMYALMASLGFATVENLLYVFQNGATVGWLRAFFTVPMHALTAVIMGYYIGLAKYPKDPYRHRHLLKGIAIAIVFHGLFNTFIVSEWWVLAAVAPLMVGYAWYVALRASKLHAKNSPHNHH